MQCCCYFFIHQTRQIFHSLKEKKKSAVNTVFWMKPEIQDINVTFSICGTIQVKLQDKKQAEY